MNTKPTRFHQYRYQIIPVDRFQLSMFQDLSVEEIIRRKNEFFADALASIRIDEFRSAPILHKLLSEGNSHVLTIAVLRGLQRDTEDFSQETIENWPRIRIVFQNDPDVQIANVEVNTKAFAETGTILGVLQGALNVHLGDYDLSVIFYPIVEKTAFWDLVRRYQNRVTEVEFHLTTPNMSNISARLSDELVGLSKRSNSASVDIGLKSNDQSHLRLDESDPLLQALSEYAAEGGGRVTLKISGYKKISTNDQVQEISADEVELQSATAAGAQAVSDVLRRLL